MLNLAPQIGGTAVLTNKPSAGENLKKAARWQVRVADRWEEDLTEPKTAEELSKLWDMPIFQVVVILSQLMRNQGTRRQYFIPENFYRRPGVLCRFCTTKFEGASRRGVLVARPDKGVETAKIEPLQPSPRRPIPSSLVARSVTTADLVKPSVSLEGAARIAGVDEEAILDWISAHHIEPQYGDGPMRIALKSLQNYLTTIAPKAAK